MRTNDINGAVTEHWMDKRLRQHKPINYPTNLIRISAPDLLILHQYKNELLGESKSLVDASEDSKTEQEEYLY